MAGLAAITAGPLAPVPAARPAVQGRPRLRPVTPRSLGDPTVRGPEAAHQERPVERPAPRAASSTRAAPSRAIDPPVARRRERGSPISPETREDSSPRPVASTSPPAPPRRRPLAPVTSTPSGQQRSVPRRRSPASALASSPDLLPTTPPARRLAPLGREDAPSLQPPAGGRTREEAPRLGRLADGEEPAAPAAPQAGSSAGKGPGPAPAAATLASPMPVVLPALSAPAERRHAEALITDGLRDERLETATERPRVEGVPPAGLALAPRLEAAKPPGTVQVTPAIAAPPPRQPKVSIEIGEVLIRTTPQRAAARPGPRGVPPRAHAIDPRLPLRAGG